MKELTLKLIEDHLTKTTSIYQELSLGWFIEDYLGPTIVIDNECWSSLFYWGETSIYKQIETLKLANIL